jgi:ribosomal-protein-alanine N-acetyltransferase
MSSSLRMPSSLNFSHYQSARLLMRKPSINDIDRLFEIFGDPATNTFNPAGPYTHREKAEATVVRWQEHWATHGFGEWAVCLKSASEHVIGFGGLSHAMFGEHRRVNLGYRFAAEVWGKGIASEFADAAVLAGFQLLNLDGIYAKVSEDHLASRRVLEKAGLRQSGLLHEVPGASPGIVYEIKRLALEIYA